MRKTPAVFLLHHKCASTWLGQVLESYCAKANLRIFGTDISGSVPPSNEYDVVVFTNSFYQTCADGCRDWLDKSPQPAVHVIRNPLDLVVSAYYSHLKTHRSDRWPALARQREILCGLDKATGMMATWVFLERSDFHQRGAVGPLFSLRSWDFTDPRIKTLRMEDLVSNEALLQFELVSRFGLDPTDSIAQFRFEKLSGGRPRGVVENEHHFRSGKADQWMEEMDLSLARAIYLTYQPLMDQFYPDVKTQLQERLG